MPLAAFWLALARFSERLNPSLMAAYLVALDEIRKRIPDREVERLIQTGDAIGVAGLVLAEPTLRHAFADFRTAIRDAITRSAIYFGRDVPPTRVSGNVLRVQFDLLEPRTLEAVRTFEVAVLEETGITMNDAIVQAVEDGLTRGIGARQIARGIRDTVGLTPSMEVWVRNLRDQLVRGDMALLQRQLLDKRFIPTIRKAFQGDGLTAAQIEKIVARYRESMIAKHASDVARTVSINSMKIGKLEVWQQSVDQGVVAAVDLEEEWRATPDNRTRVTHRALNGTKIPFGGRWYVPGVGYVRYPGEKEFNCRCVPVIRVKRAATSA